MAKDKANFTTKMNAALDLLNSEYNAAPGRAVDDLKDGAWVAAFLVRWSFPIPGNPRELDKLRALRRDLRFVVDDIVRTRAVSEAALIQLQAWMPAETTRPRLRREVSGGVGVVHEPQRPRRASAEVAWAFVALLAHDGLHRIKVCEHEDCTLTFFDESRNRSRRWCDPADCGNVMKVRAFRKRKASTQPAS
jgi:predicted RNA-binding Zn ribbon-like protein